MIFCVLTFWPATLLLAAPVKSAIDTATVAVSAGLHSAGFRLPQNTSQPIVEYRQSLPLLGKMATQPVMKVFADGRVQVHKPMFMKQPGDYEYTLSPAELLALIQGLIKDGMVDFDETKVMRARQAAEDARRKRGELYAVSDAEITTIQLNLDSYQSSIFAPVQAVINKQLRWQNLETDARRFRGITALQGLEHAVQTLNGLRQHPAMRKVR